MECDRCGDIFDGKKVRKFCDRCSGWRRYRHTFRCRFCGKFSVQRNWGLPCIGLYVVPRRWTKEMASQCLYCNGPMRYVEPHSVEDAEAELLFPHIPVFKEWYRSVYLQSELWAVIRYRILARDGGRCRNCGDNADQVHHLEYSRETLAGYKDECLMAVCRRCHEKIHANRHEPVLLPANC